MPCTLLKHTPRIVYQDLGVKKAHGKGMVTEDKHHHRLHRLHPLLVSHTLCPVLRTMSYRPQPVQGQALLFSWSVMSLVLQAMEGDAGLGFPFYSSILSYLNLLAIIAIQSFVEAFPDEIETKVATNRICKNVT